MIKFTIQNILNNILNGLLYSGKSIANNIMIRKIHGTLAIYLSSNQGKTAWESPLTKLIHEHRIFFNHIMFMMKSKNFFLHLIKVVDYVWKCQERVLNHHTCAFLIRAVLEASRYCFVKHINETKRLTKEKNILSNVLGIQHPSPVIEFSNQPSLNSAGRKSKRPQMWTCHNILAMEEEEYKIILWKSGSKLKSW